MTLVYKPELLYTGARFERERALVVSDNGVIAAVAEASGQLERQAQEILLPGRAILPGLVDVHSHSFQRTIRGTVESRLKAGPDFWSWRDAMYRAANRFHPEELHSIARMAFLEMALSGITTIGEFHYLHRDPDGAPYDDPNEIAMQIIRAAEDIGIRIALLRTAYVRAGFNKPPDTGQRRFLEPDPENFIANTQSLRKSLSSSNGMAWVGVAPHSIRAVPLSYLREITDWANAEALPIHMHVAEQPAENTACQEEYGLTPFALLDREGILNGRFTAIHGIHLDRDEFAVLGRTNAIVGACPTTERNLGDGILRADEMMRAGVRIAFGSDSLTEINPLENARQLEYNLRLRKLERAVLDTIPEDGVDSLPQRLFQCATIHGSSSLGSASGALKPGSVADFFTVDLRDPSIAGTDPDSLLAAIVFGLSRTAIRETAVNGRLIISQGRHFRQDEIVDSYLRVMQQEAYL